MNQMEYPIHILNQKENSKLKRCSTLEIHRLLVALRHIIRGCSVIISTLCMGGSLCGIFYKNSPLICCIFQSHSALSKYKKAAMKFVSGFLFCIEQALRYVTNG